MNEKTAADRQPCILVVDDSEDMCTMLAQLLRKAGYQVVLATDGQTALTQAKQYHPDLILMDLSLPDIDGWEAVRLLRKMPEFRTTPIIAVTAHVSDGDKERALAVGCNIHVGKPFKNRSLLQTIEQLLEDGENEHEH